jgi:hypothetical protein
VEDTPEIAQLRKFMDDLIQKIEGHDKYGPAMKAAAQAQKPIILDYHTHGPGQDYCLSIKTKKAGLPVLGQAPQLEELAHIKGLGKTLDEGIPIMGVLGEQMQAYYKLQSLPSIFINGKPTT